MRGGRRRNDAQEFERLYRENYQYVYNYIYSRFLNRSFTEDVVSEAFINAARAFDRFDPSRAKFSTWVITIARNCATSELRKRNSEMSASDANVELDTASTSDTYFADADDERKTLESLLSVLDETDRELVHLKYYEGLQNKEIASILGMNASTVGTRVQRAVIRMREEAQRRGL